MFMYTRKLKVITTQKVNKELKLSRARTFIFMIIMPDDWECELGQTEGMYETHHGQDNERHEDAGNTHTGPEELRTKDLAAKVDVEVELGWKVLHV